MENINIDTYINLFLEQWELCENFDAETMTSDEQNVAQERIDEIRSLFDRLPAEDREVIFSRIIQQNRERISAIQSSTESNPKDIFEIRTLCLQNDVLGRGQI